MSDEGLKRLKGRRAAERIAGLLEGEKRREIGDAASLSWLKVESIQRILRDEYGIESAPMQRSDGKTVLLERMPESKLGERVLQWLGGSAIKVLRPGENDAFAKELLGANLSERGIFVARSANGTVYVRFLKPEGAQ